MERIVYDYLKEKNILTFDENVESRILLEITDTEVILSGNKLGLVMLAEYLVNIALSAKGSNVHLDQSNFFTKADKGFIIELSKNKQ